jgi:hypothetical protein
MVFQVFGRDIVGAVGDGTREPRVMPDPPVALQSFFDQIWPVQLATVAWPPQRIFPLGSLDLIFESG